MNKLLKIGSILTLLFLFQFIFTNSTYAKSGCCSHHKGVCGCSCCDGSGLSATCMTAECSGSGATQIVKPVKVVPTTIPTRKPILTLKPTIIVPTKVPQTRKPTQIIKPTLTPTIIPTSSLSPTEVISPTPTKSVVSNKSKLTETKTVKQKNKFSGFLSWLFNKK